MGGNPAGLQPIWQVRDAYVKGQPVGHTSNAPRTALAPAGYAVGQIQVRRGLAIDAVRLIYFRVDGDHLDTNDRRESAWLGSKGGHDITTIGEGNFIVAISGSVPENLDVFGAQYVTEPLRDPKIALPAITFATDELARSRRMGNEGREDLFDQAPEGGILVGAIFSKGSNWGGALQAIQPIYQVKDRYVLGKRQGKEGGESIRLLAREGFAVAGINVRTGLVMNAAQFVFARVDGQQLDRSEIYESAWVGSASGGSAREFPANVYPVVGVWGFAEDDLRGLGLILVRANSPRK
jgi:hypothetical protein